MNAALSGCGRAIQTTTPVAATPGSGDDADPSCSSHVSPRPFLVDVVVAGAVPDEAVVVGEDHQVDPVGQTEFGQQMTDVAFHAAFREMQGRPILAFESPCATNLSTISSR